MSTTKDHMIEMLPYRLRQGENINKYFQAISEMFDEIIEMFVQIQDSRDIDKSFGFGLDIIGQILGEERKGLDDESFRTILRTKIISNRSAGDIETLNNFGRLILGQFYEGLVETSTSGKMVLRYTYPLVSDPVSLMKKATAAGVKIDTQLDTYVPVCGAYTIGQLPFTKTLSAV